MRQGAAEKESCFSDSPLALRVLEKLVRRFPEASQEEILREFLAIARDDEELMRSINGLGGRLDDMYKEVMIRLRPKVRQKRPTEELVGDGSVLGLIQEKTNPTILKEGRRAALGRPTRLRVWKAE
jgi:hypothetical protein